MRFQPGTRVVVTWPDGRMFSFVGPTGSFIGRHDVRAGHATIEVVHADDQLQRNTEEQALICRDLIAHASGQCPVRGVLVD